ncbi:TetR family transcriptional regulator [Propionicimonas paludicola]|uniref:TetR family transcriptional regulator n=2 Tax=Propionicimonas paludicola TaxID=185243 RepID=A0A2A9CU32_9ACTN|nr:TetR family transcriptional regulator [Propionicimonas paludicola]
MSPDERRRAIIEATLPLLIANGPELSTKEIAKAAGIAEGTIFRVFETKAELVHATLDAALAPTEAMDALAALPDGQPLTDRLAAIIQIVSDEIARTRSLFAAVFGSRPHEGPPKPTNHRPHTDRLRIIRTGLADALAPYTDQLSASIERTSQLIVAVSVAGRMFSTDHQLEDPAEWAELLAHGIAKGKQ